MRHVKLTRPALVGNCNHEAGDVVLVNDDRGADLINEGFAEFSQGPESIANPDVNRLQDAIDPAPPATYAPLSEDGLTGHPTRAAAQAVDDNPGLVKLRKAAEASPDHDATGARKDRPKPADRPNTAATTPNTTRQAEALGLAHAPAPAPADKAPATKPDARVEPKKD